MSHVERFFEECCEREKDASIGAGELFSAYKEWCFQKGVERLGLHGFHRERKLLGIKQSRDVRRRFYEDWKLIGPVVGGQEKTDEIEQFFEGHCEPCYGASINARELFEAYKKWCFLKKIKAIDYYGFRRRIDMLGVWQTSAGANLFYENWKLVEMAEGT